MWNCHEPCKLINDTVFRISKLKYHWMENLCVEAVVFIDYLCLVAKEEQIVVTDDENDEEEVSQIFQISQQ